MTGAAAGGGDGHLATRDWPPAALAQLSGLLPQGQTQLVAVLQPEGPLAGGIARKSRRTLALEAYLNTVCCASRMSPTPLCARTRRQQPSTSANTLDVAQRAAKASTPAIA